MPVKSTPASTPAKATTPRKRRTRKTSTPAKATTRKVAVKKPVAKTTVEEKAFDLTSTELKQVEKLISATPKVTTTTFVSGKVVAKKTELVRPSAPLIQWKDYQRDFKNRLDIHNYEIQELIKDMTKMIDFLKPYHAQVVKMVNK
jgi:hypothetical protein